jgi:hypothetical protein
VTVRALAVSIAAVLVWPGCDCSGGRSDRGDAGGADASTEREPDASATDGGDDRDAGASDAGGEVDDGRVHGEVTRLDEDERAYLPRAAIDGHGNATVVWSNPDAVVSRRWEAGAWEDPVWLGPGDDPRVAFDAFGHGVATWRDLDARRTVARLWEPGQGWGLEEMVGPGLGYTGEVAIDGRGVIVALFDWSYDAANRVRTVRYDPGIGWSEHGIVEPQDIFTRMPDVAASEAGYFVGTWTHFVHVSDVIGDETVFASRELGGWQPAVGVGVPMVGSVHPSVAVDGAGNALVAWGDNDDEAYSLWAARQPIAGEWDDEPHYLGDGDGAWTFAAAMSFDGTGFVAWAWGSTVEVARWVPGEGWQDAEIVDGRDAAVDDHDALAIDADEAGGAIVVWLQTIDEEMHVWGKRWVPDVGWTETVDLDPELVGDAERLSLDVAPDGTAVVAWQVEVDDEPHVWAAILPSDWPWYSAPQKGVQPLLRPPIPRHLVAEVLSPPCDVALPRLSQPSGPAPRSPAASAPSRRV